MATPSPPVRIPGAVFVPGDILSLITLCSVLFRLQTFAFLCPQGFVCQQYLQSYSASGLVLLDSFPPAPGKRRMAEIGRGPEVCLCCCLPFLKFRLLV